MGIKVKKGKFSNKKNHTSRKKNPDNVVLYLWLAIGSTFLALIPQWIIRSRFDIYYKLFERFGTYSGDIWYCWENYLSKGFAYPIEYPSGIQLIFKFLFKVKPEWFKYEHYMIVMSLFLGLFAIGVTYILYNIVIRTHKDKGKLWVFWILAPSFLFYGLMNMDFMSIFTMVLAYYLFIEEEYYMAAAILALGTTIKVFPFFLTPLFFFQAPKEKRAGSLISFVIIWIVFNVPFMVADYNSWMYPYKWQIQNNYATNPTQDCWWWVVTKYLLPPEKGQIIGKLSLLLYAALYYFFLSKKWNYSLARKSLGIVLLFLLTDRIYSPQYSLYMLPFLVLVDYRVSLFWFYFGEIPNMLERFFYFKIKEGNPAMLGMESTTFPYIFQTLMLMKYIGLLMLFIQMWKAPVVLDTDAEFARNRDIEMESEVKAKKALA